MIKWKGELNKFRNKDKTEKIKFIFSTCIWVIMFFTIFSIHSLSNLSHYIPILFSVIFAILSLIYIFLYGKFQVDFVIVFYSLFFLLGLIMTCIISHNFTSLKTYLTIFLLFFIVYQFLLNSYHPKLFCFLYLVSIMLFSLWFLLHYRENILSFFKGSTSLRLGSYFGGINLIASNLLSGITICFIYMLLFKKYVFPTISLVILFVCIIMTGSKTPFIGTILGLIVFFFLLLWKKHKFILLAIYAVLISGFILILSLPVFSYLKERIFNMLNVFSSNSFDYSTAQRFSMFVSGLEYWSKYLFTGAGAGGFSSLSGYDSYSHSTISEILCDFGLIGTFLFFAPIFFVVFTSKKESQSKKSWVMLITTYVLIGLIGTVILGHKVFYLMMALLFSIYFNENKKRITTLEMNFMKNKRFKFNYYFNKGIGINVLHFLKKGFSNIDA